MQHSPLRGARRFGAATDCSSLERGGRWSGRLEGGMGCPGVRTPPDAHRHQRPSRATAFPIRLGPPSARGGPGPLRPWPVAGGPAAWWRARVVFCLSFFSLPCRRWRGHGERLAPAAFCRPRRSHDGAPSEALSSLAGAHGVGALELSPSASVSTCAVLRERVDRPGPISGAATGHHGGGPNKPSTRENPPKCRPIRPHHVSPSYEAPSTCDGDSRAARRE